MTDFHGLEEYGFFGLADDAEAAELKSILERLQSLCSGNHFIGDMMCVFGRVFSFTEDHAFMEAAKNNAMWPPDQSRIWRMHTLVWAARSALHLEGDFVEYGVFTGLSAGTIADTLRFGQVSKSFYLYDTFDGLAPEYSSDAELARTEGEYAVLPEIYPNLVKRFSAYRNVHIVKGIVPDVLHEKSPEKVAFLHLDLNAAQAEIGALEVLFDKIVPGGFIVFDDFGHIRGKEQNIAERAWMGSRDYDVLELPTGQGLVIKR